MKPKHSTLVSPFLFERTLDLTDMSTNAAYLPTNSALESHPDQRSHGEICAKKRYCCMRRCIRRSLSESTEKFHPIFSYPDLTWLDLNTNITLPSLLTLLPATPPTPKIKKPITNKSNSALTDIHIINPQRRPRDPKSHLLRRPLRRLQASHLSTTQTPRSTAHQQQQ